MNKKEEVINAARDLFTKYGYKKVSMDEISEANVTKKTIYSYFSDKEAIFKYFASEELQSMKEKIENDVNSSTSFIDRVSKILYESLLFRKNSDLIKTIIKEISKNNTAECISFLKLYDDEIASYIEEKIKQEIQNKTIMDIQRRGKWLLFDLGDYILLSHLRMEGKYFLLKNESNFPHF